MHASDTSIDLPMQHGPWRILQRTVAYQDPWMTVCMDNVIRPDAKPGTYSTVRIKPGVCVIPIDERGMVHLTREFHYAVGKLTIEGISGGIDDGESALEAAKRELQEEVGILANRWVPLGYVDPLSSALLSPTALFLATELSYTESNCEGTECIERVEYPFATALQMVMDSEITHGPSCVAILKAHAWRTQAGASGAAS